MPTSPRILVIGAINIDLVIEVDRLPEEGETLVGKKMTQASGGKGANQAAAVAKLGGRATFCGRVGDDDWGRLVAASLEKTGVDTSSLLIDAQRDTGSAIILVEPGGKNQIIAVAGANLGVTSADVDRALDAGARFDAVMLTLETPVETVRHAIAKASAMKVPVILDAAPPATYPLDVFRGVTVLSPNETEAQSLTGIRITSLDDALQAAKLLHTGSGAKHAVMKLGDKGALILDDQGSRHVKPLQVRAVDTTACGDAFTAALTMGLCAGVSIDEAVRYGCAAGAATATKRGAQVSLPTAQEVAALA